MSSSGGCATSWHLQTVLSPFLEGHVQPELLSAVTLFEDLQIPFDTSEQISLAQIGSSQLGLTDMLQGTLTISGSRIRSTQGVKIARGTVVFLGAECLLKVIDRLIDLVLMKQDSAKMKMGEAIIGLVLKSSPKVPLGFLHSSLVQQEKAKVVVCFGIKGTNLEGLPKRFGGLTIPSLRR